MFRTILAAGVVGGAAISLDARSNAFLASDSKMDVSAEISETLQDMAMDLLSINPVEGMASVRQGVNAVSSKLDLKTALKAVAHKNLPADVRSLVTSASSSNTDFDETSMAKARIALNSLVEKSWVELDDKIIQCKEYQEMNRATFDQVTIDISRLVEQITDLERVETESLEGIAKTEMQIKEVEAELSKETKIYNYNLAKNTEELTKRQNDLDVFQFILTFTRCPDATSLLQNNHNRSAICSIKGHGHAMCFEDHATQIRFNQMMTHSSRRTISQILAEVEGQKLQTNFLQLSEDPPSGASNGFTTTPNPALAANLAQPPEIVFERPGQGFVPAPFCCEAYGVSCGKMGGGLMCSPDDHFECGPLHDRLSLLWGDYKDKVDELTMEMNKNAYLFEELKFTLNDQITLLTNTKARFAMMLSEARSNLAADREEVKAKDQQKLDLEKAYIGYMKKCCERVKWIMFQDMCAIIVVRNAVLSTSTTCPGDQIVDCDVDNWVGAQCTVDCDDTCAEVPDPTEVYECGGWQHINRKVVVAPDECGLRCPELGRTKKCNQKRCAVNCEMSEWSGWSKCTADCEGGVRSQTRSMLVKPKNGGVPCNTAEVTEACNTMSCDRDCKLAGWTDWTPCSVACGGGMQSAAKHVLIPTRGFGKCPLEDGPKRFKEQQCNTQDCVGDEICVAVQDLIIAIDGSGSVRETDFGILKAYAKDLLSKYRSEYFGRAAMKVGLVEFGNGIIMPDGVTVSPAMNLHALTTDLTAIDSALDGMVRKKGFTNMAQAFALAETMYTSAGRKGAQSALLVITDGKPSFQFQTTELVEQLDDKGVQRFFVVVTENKKSVELMRRYASAPWETNMLHVPGLQMLQADQSLWTQKALTLFCPMAMSLELLEVKERSGGYMHVKDGGYCGGRGALLSTEVADAKGCAFLANGAGAQSFLLGSWFRRGYCYAGTMEVSNAQYTEWEAARSAPACPTEWVNSMIFDYYAMEPLQEESS